ncbi:MAG: MCE family protein [Planctomycetota bacterium]|nr:MAG: MCE family protein [Planctomycetota bacterium]
MSQTTNHWKLGLFVVLSLVVAFLGLVWLSSKRWSRDYVVAITFFDESVQGLETGSPVKFRGVTIGNVQGITVAEDRRHLLVRSEINLESLARLGLRDEGPVRWGDGEFVPDDLKMQIAASGITGGKFLQVDFFDEVGSDLVLDFEPPWNYIPSRPSTLKSLEEGVVEMMEAIPSLLDKVDRILDSLEQQIQAAQLAEVSASATGLIVELEKQLQEMALGQSSEKLQQSLTEVQGAASELRAFIGDLRDPEAGIPPLIGRVGQTLDRVEGELETAKVAETTAALRRTLDALTALAQEAGLLGEDLGSELKGLGEAVDALRALADVLERDPGALLRGRHVTEKE